MTVRALLVAASTRASASTLVAAWTRASASTLVAAWTRVFASIAFVVAANGCTGKDPYRPGSAMGTFHVEAKRVANSCGEAVVPPDPWTFDVRLSRDDARLYWVQGSLPVSGALDTAKPDAPRASMTSSTTGVVRAADAKHGLAACALTRDDTLEAILARGIGAEADFESFTGTLAYRFTPTSDSDCSDAIAGAGEDGFADLPCEVRFELAGTVDKTIAKR